MVLANLKFQDQVEEVVQHLVVAVVVAAKSKVHMSWVLVPPVVGPWVEVPLRSSDIQLQLLVVH